MLKLDRGALPITEMPLTLYTKILYFQEQPIFRDSKVIISQEKIFGKLLNRIFEIIPETKEEIALLKRKDNSYDLDSIRNVEPKDLEKLKFKK